MLELAILLLIIPTMLIAFKLIHLGERVKILEKGDYNELLKHGEKFEAMWKELKDKNMCFSWRLDEEIEELQQKYFPKEVKKNENEN